MPASSSQPEKRCSANAANLGSDDRKGGPSFLNWLLYRRGGLAAMWDH